MLIDSRFSANFAGSWVYPEAFEYFYLSFITQHISGPEKRFLPNTRQCQFISVGKQIACVTYKPHRYPGRGCAIFGLKISRMFYLGGFFCLYFVVVRANFYPVDFTPLTTYKLQQGKLTDASYFRSWLATVIGPVGIKLARSGALTQWEYETNITKANEADTVKVSQLSANFSRIAVGIASQFNLSRSRNARMKVVQKKMMELGDAALDPAELTELVGIINRMQSTYSTAKICFDPNDEVNSYSGITTIEQCPEAKRTTLDPALINFMKNSTWDSDKRRYVWKAWRDVSGKVVRKDYLRYVELKNKAARLSGYKDAGDHWRSQYTDESLHYNDENFLADLDELWSQIGPLYEELHAYVRRKLIQKLPDQDISPTEPIPAHLLGDMFSQEWVSMLNFTQLYPSKPLLDVTEEMKAQNYTVQKMFHLSEQFQNDLGLIPMPQSFWKETMFEKPKDRDVVCHASAWDMYTNSDVRIKMCTEVNMDDLITIHHEMGHIQYFLQYSKQLLNFRSGANAGFHEAVGDTLALSVRTPKHLAWLGLLHHDKDDSETDLNYMFATALDKIAFLPFAYIMDRYRYDVFSGKIKTENLNAGWWDYALEYQGITPPVDRSEDDFDPGAKFHVAADVEYMRYFVSFIIQFQFHKALCDAAGHAGPLYQCDINQSKEAGKLLSSMLSLGASEPWQVAMQRITGSTKMDASPLLEFFQPLMEYLTTENQKNGDVTGW